MTRINLPLSLFLYLTFLPFLIHSLSTTTLSYQLLSEGEQILLDLQDYFTSASNSSINLQKSSKNYQDVFDTIVYQQSYRNVTEINMEFLYKGNLIRLSDYTFYVTKGLYNQPIKIFLLSNNMLLMYIYNQQQIQNQENIVIGLNLTQQIPTFYRNKKINCTSIQTQSSIQNFDFLFVLCRYTDKQFKNDGYVILQVQFSHNTQGFINGMKVIDYVNNTNFINLQCQMYSLKYFNALTINNFTTKNNSIFMYCVQKSKLQAERIFYFQRPSTRIYTIMQPKLSQCMNYASYISSNSDTNGFLSIIDNKVYEFYTNQTTYQSTCQSNDLGKLNYSFAATRTYNNVDVTFIFLKNNSIIIRSSYRTNHQKIDILRQGFHFTSYGLTSQLMVLTLSNGEQVILLVYNMEQLYPKLIDQIHLENVNGSLNGSFLMSTGNYLEKGYYVFFYSRSTNKMRIAEYVGYMVNIQPKMQMNLSFFGEISEQNYMKQTQKQIFQGDSPTNNYTICITSQNQTQQLIIFIIVRKFNDSSIALLPIQQLKVDSPYINFNVSTMAIGPGQHFYVQNNKSDTNINMLFMNNYNTINISQLDPSSQKIQTTKYKQISLNLQLKLLNPSLSFYYNSYIRNCVLNYNEKSLIFYIECQPGDIITYKTILKSNSTKIIVLAKQNWLEHSEDQLQICTIISGTGLCEQLDLDYLDAQNIIKIKLVQYVNKNNGYIYIQIFVLRASSLVYGFFVKKSSSEQSKFQKFNKIFTISNKTFPLLNTMKLKNIHFDQGYTNFLLLHFHHESKNMQSALLYDRPQFTTKKQFLGHLLKTFNDSHIQSIMTIDSLVIILSRMDNNQVIINQFKVTQYYSVFHTRMYPLYGRNVTVKGDHASDGQFIYIEVDIQSGPKQNKTQYLVYCPSLTATNVLMRVMPKQSVIQFVQVIGSSKNKYPHSIGVNGQNIFSISVPNLSVKFQYNQKRKQTNLATGKQFVNKSTEVALKNQTQNSVVSGTLLICLIDFQNTLHFLPYKYFFDISSQNIRYNPKYSTNLKISQSNPNATINLQMQKINGPVMSYNLQVQDCPFLQQQFTMNDIFSKLQCLANIDSKQYGTLLDMTTVQFSIGISFQLILTSQFLICVSNKKISLKKTLPVAQTCSFADKLSPRGLFVCDEGQGSVISMFSLNGQDCGSLQHKKIDKPTWLIYQYFKLKYKDPYAIFQIPIRVQSNKIYFICQFDFQNQNFSNNFLSLTHKELDHFLSMDFDIDEAYAYILQQGLGIYSLDDYSKINGSVMEPKAWISNEEMGKKLNTNERLVYIKPQMQFQKENVQNGKKCSEIFSNSIHMEIGTQTRAYRVKICFNDDEQQQQYEIVLLVIYEQYKDCKNNAQSKSKTVGEITLKLCILQLEEHRIFSNYIPIFSKTSEYYMQFYAIDQQNDGIQVWPFRMQKISTNDSFQIKQLQKQLIVRSLFNFMCYYQLDIQVKWTLYRNSTYLSENNYNWSQNKCSASIILSNQNYIHQFHFDIINEDVQPIEAYKPWIYRVIYFLLVCLSLWKLRVHIKNRKTKLTKIRNNLFSNQFETKVRVNSKKSIQVQLLNSLDHIS